VGDEATPRIFVLRHLGIPSVLLKEALVDHHTYYFGWDSWNLWGSRIAIGIAWPWQKPNKLNSVHRRPQPTTCKRLAPLVSTPPYL
jgi:hypothetical protein